MYKYKILKKSVNKWGKPSEHKTKLYPIFKTVDIRKTVFTNLNNAHMSQQNCQYFEINDKIPDLSKIMLIIFNKKPNCNGLNKE